MALSMDNASVLRAMADHPEAFSAVQADLHEFLRKVLVKQMKAKTTGLASLRALSNALGERNLRMVMDHLTASDLAGSIKRADPHCVLGRSGADAEASRRHLAALASGEVSLTAVPDKPERPAKRAAKPKSKPEVSKIGTMLESKVHSGKPRASRAKTTT